MRPRLLLGLALVIAVLSPDSARGQDDPAPAGPPVSDGPAVGAESATAAFQTLERELREARAEWANEQRLAMERARKAADEAVAQGRRSPGLPAMSMNSPVDGEYLPRYAAFAEAHPDASEAVDALVFVVTYGARLSDPAAAQAAFATLLARHVDDPRFERIVLVLDRWPALVPEPATVRADIFRRATSDGVRAAALYGPVARTFALGSKASSDDRAAGRHVLERVVREYPDTRCGRMAAGALNEMDLLQVGQVAPDFEGQGADGKTLRLSDFRGKAVLLSFWGFW